MKHYPCITCGKKMRNHNHFCTLACKEDFLHSKYKDTVIVSGPWKCENESAPAVNELPQPSEVA